MRMLVYISCLFTIHVNCVTYLEIFPAGPPPTDNCVFILRTVKKILITAISENSSFLAKSLIPVIYGRLWETEYFLTSFALSLVSSCPLVLLYTLFLNIRINIFVTIQYLENTSIRSTISLHSLLSCMHTHVIKTRKNRIFNIILRNIRLMWKLYSDALLVRVRMHEAPIA